jgi:hypothetical protein
MPSFAKIIIYFSRLQIFKFYLFLIFKLHLYTSCKFQVEFNNTNFARFQPTSIDCTIHAQPLWQNWAMPLDSSTTQMAHNSLWLGMQQIPLFHSFNLILTILPNFKFDCSWETKKKHGTYLSLCKPDTRWKWFMWNLRSSKTCELVPCLQKLWWGLWMIKWTFVLQSNLVGQLW